jgi:hypothetical protein
MAPRLFGKNQPLRRDHDIKMEGSEQERQLIEVLRDHDSDATSDFRLLVQRQDGAWDVTF